MRFLKFLDSNYEFFMIKTGDAPPEGAIGVSNRAAALSTWN